MCACKQQQLNVSNWRAVAAATANVVAIVVVAVAAAAAAAAATGRCCTLMVKIFQKCLLI